MNKCRDCEFFLTDEDWCEVQEDGMLPDDESCADFEKDKDGEVTS